jgi:hypothetical protein
LKEYKVSQWRDDLRARADNGNSYAAGRLVLAARDRQDIDQDAQSVPQEAALLPGCFMGDPCSTARGRTRPADSLFQRSVQTAGRLKHCALAQV